MRVGESSRKKTEAKEGVTDTAQAVVVGGWYVVVRGEQRVIIVIITHIKRGELTGSCIPISHSALEEVCTWHRLVANRSHACKCTT